MKYCNRVPIFANVSTIYFVNQLLQEMLTDTQGFVIAPATVRFETEPDGAGGKVLVLYAEIQHEKT